MLSTCHRSYRHGQALDRVEEQVEPQQARRQERAEVREMFQCTDTGHSLPLVRSRDLLAVASVVVREVRPLTV